MRDNFLLQIIQMILHEAVVCAFILHLCCGWEIKSSEVNKIQQLKTKCILMCPFQKQTSDLYIDDITCEIDCKIQHCVKGCHFLEAALKTDCQDLCNVTNHVLNSSHIFCFIGCEQSLMEYFGSIRSEISHLQAPTLMEHTLSATSLTLEWIEPSLVNENYLLQCCNVDISNAWQFCENQTWIARSIVHVQNLQPYTKYQFRVAVRLTPGDWYKIFSSSSSIIATLPGGLPTSPPKILAATAVTFNMISVIWEEGQFSNGPIISYILQVNEQPVGYAGVKDLPAVQKSHSCMLKNLLPSTSYLISVSARNSVGLGPPASVTVKTKPYVDKIKDSIDLMVATDHSVYSINSDVHEEPVLVYNTTHLIRGIALHVHRELLYISDSSGSVIVTSSKGLLTPQELPVPASSKPSELTVDWLNDYLYILSEILHPSGSVVYEVARCTLDGNNLVVVISGFIVKPHHIEIDPYNGYLFWVVRGVGLYRLDLIDISKTINKNVSPEVILEDSNLGGFLVNSDHFRIIISVCSLSTINAISLDGQEVEKLCEKSQNPKFQNVLSLALISGSLFWTNGEKMFQEICDSYNRSILHNITDKLFMQNSKAVVANTLSSQSFPVPVNPPTNFQAIFGHDIAKVSWDKPYRLAGQGDGAWSAWSYRLVVESKNRIQVFDFSDIKANQYTVSSLKSGTEYILKVAAYTSTGEGPWSTEFRGKTLHRNASLLWSNNEGLLLSDITGYRVTKIEPINYLEADDTFLISDIDWFEDQVFVSTDKQQVFWYNLTSNTYGRIQDVNDANCISVEWLSKKLYWGNNKNKMIFRASFSGNEQEILPIIVAAESLFLDAYAAYFYWSTKNTVEGACLDGTQRRTFYESKNPYVSEIVGLALDIGGSELYWIEKTSAHPRQSALMIINIKRYNRNYNSDFLIDKFTLINQDVEGGICYIDQHLVWVRSDDKNAMISGLNGTTTALIHSDNLSNLVTCTAVDPFIRTMQSYQGNISEKINVIPDPVQKSTIKIEGLFDTFNVIWDAVTNVNYGRIFYRVRIKIDDVDSLIETPETSIAIRNKKAYTPVKIVVQSFTYWAASNAVRVTLRSPSSTPSPPMNPRIFVTHKRNKNSQQKKVSVLFRWSPPAEPNGVIEHYELACWVTNNRTNLPGTMCSSSQISTRTLEFTLQNLPFDKVYQFQVRACTDHGCGLWSEVLKTNFQNEIALPKLFITTKDGLIDMDYDRKSFIIAIVEIKNARDIFYDASEDNIYWIQKNYIYLSNLNLPVSNIEKFVELQSDGNALSYDWIARYLYWIEINGRVSSVKTLDLNRNEEDRRQNTLFKRQSVIKNIVVSPMNSALYWVESEKPENIFGTLMKCSIDGSRMKEFFSKDISFAKNDVSSLIPHTSDEQDIFCSWNKSWVGPSISLHPFFNNHYRILWFDILSGFIASSNLDGYNCKRIVEVRNTAVSGIPQSITADFIRVYWLDAEGTAVFSASINEPFGSIEKIPAYAGTRLQNILAYGTHLQNFPDSRCLWPHLQPGNPRIVKYSSDSVVLELPSVVRETICRNVSMAPIEYTVYFGIINDNGDSNCTLNLKLCSQLVTYDSIKKISKLKPYTSYVFLVGIGNYYSQMEGKDPVVSSSIVCKTASGIPSAARNVTSIPLTPHAVFLKWLPPEHFNAEAVGYSVHYLTQNSNSSYEVDEYSTTKFFNTSIILDNLESNQEYIIWVKTFPIVENKPALNVGYKYSENVTVRTYPEPENVTLTNRTSNSMNLSAPENLDKYRFVFEIHNSTSETWNTASKTNEKYLFLQRLTPLTSCKVRLKIWYTVFYTPFLWIPDGFEFFTLGDKPTIPGIPILIYLNNHSFQVTWKPSHNYGHKPLMYWMDARFMDLDHGDLENGYSEWTVYYNGTDNLWISTTLKRNVKYQFRVKSENEYGFSEYSNVSEEYDVENDRYTKIPLWSILPVFCMTGIIALIVLIYVCYCKLVSSHRDKFEKDEILSSNKNCNLELINLPEIPAGSNSVNNNSLYIPQMEECQFADEFVQIPRVRREQITLTKFLGSGAFGEVYEGKVKNLLYANVDTRVAIKALRKNATEQEKAEFLREASLMSNFKHQHILQLLGVCTDHNPHFIIMELMEGGDLLSYLRSNRSSSTSSTLVYQDLLRICCDVASGCCYLEELHFVHRDLACRNCLVSSKDPAHRIVKIGDFGLARDIYKNDYYRKEGEGLLPVRWMAPESLVDGVFTRHSDVWSFGVLLWEVMSLGQQPYQARSNVEVLQYVRSGGRLNRPTNCPSKLYELMQKCWCNQPKDRPTFVYCLFELETLKNDCNHESVIANYTTYSPVLEGVS